MNRAMNYGVAGMLCGPLLIALLGGEAFPLDRRFELDPQLLERKIPSRAIEKRAPPLQRASRKGTARGKKRAVIAGAESDQGRLSLLKLTPPPSGPEEFTPLRALWERLVPGAESEGPLELGGDNFSLTLDPGKFQVIPAADGGRIIIDANRSIPPLVRSLIQEKNPTVRIVSQAPRDGKSFYSQLLRSAGFYSVEPDFILEFGDDPRLSVRADYRIERTADSLLRNETVLLYTSVGRYATPESLQRFLGRAGFQFLEPDLPQHDSPAGKDRFIQASGGSRLQVADTVLAGLGLATEAGKAIEFSGWLQQGINLTVHVDRSFVCKGRSYVLTLFDGNPVSYTLTRLLESRGVTVVLLAPADDFRAVTGKLLAALKLPARYDLHRLWPLRETPYTVQMSGFLVRDPDSHRTVFLTDREVSPLMLDLIARNGYAVTAVQP